MALGVNQGLCASFALSRSKEKAADLAGGLNQGKTAQAPLLKHQHPHLVSHAFLASFGPSRRPAVP